jgi:hypothetical protein
MRFDIIPPYGFEGPCFMACHHADCKLMMNKANQICLYCTTKIGYNKAYIISDKGEYIHLDCELERIHDERIF